MKKISKILLNTCLIFTAITLLSGCESTELKEKTYSSRGFSITMEDGMVEKDLASSTVYFEGQRVLVSGIKETFEALEVIELSKDSTIEEYAQAVLANNKAEYEIKTDGDLKYFTYENEFSGKPFYYFSAFVKGSDAFWLVNFACETSNKEEYNPYFIK